MNTNTKITPAQSRIVALLQGGSKIEARYSVAQMKWIGYLPYQNEKLSMATLDALVSSGLVLCDGSKHNTRIYSLPNA